MAVGAGVPCRFRSSAAFEVAIWSRSASVFKFGFGVVCVVSGLSEREHAPSEKAQASKMTVRIVFIGEITAFLSARLHCYIALTEEATVKDGRAALIAVRRVHYFRPGPSLPMDIPMGIMAMNPDPVTVVPSPMTRHPIPANAMLPVIRSMVVIGPVADLD